MKKVSELKKGAKSENKAVKPQKLDYASFREVMIVYFGTDIDNLEVFKCKKANRLIKRVFKQIEYCTEKCKNKDICLKQISSRLVLANNENKKELQIAKEASTEAESVAAKVNGVKDEHGNCFSG